MMGLSEMFNGASGAHNQLKENGAQFLQKLSGRYKKDEFFHNYYRALSAAYGTFLNSFYNDALRVYKGRLGKIKSMYLVKFIALTTTSTVLDNDEFLSAHFPVGEWSLQTAKEELTARVFADLEFTQEEQALSEEYIRDKNNPESKSAAAMVEYFWEKAAGVKVDNIQNMQVQCYLEPRLNPFFKFFMMF